MGTIKLHFEPEAFVYRSNSPFPSYRKFQGDVSPSTALVFAKVGGAPEQQRAFLTFRAINYGSGPWTARIGWFCPVEATGTVMWTIALSCLSANTDVIALGSRAFDTGNVFYTAHRETIASRPQDDLAALSNLDSVAIDDWVTLSLLRNSFDISDTVSGDVALRSLDLSWSDT